MYLDVGQGKSVAPPTIYRDVPYFKPGWDGSSYATNDHNARLTARQGRAGISRANCYIFYRDVADCRRAEVESQGVELFVAENRRIQRRSVNARVAGSERWRLQSLNRNNACRSSRADSQQADRPTGGRDHRGRDARDRTGCQSQSKSGPGRGIKRGHCV